MVTIFCVKYCLMVFSNGRIVSASFLQCRRQLQRQLYWNGEISSTFVQFIIKFALLTKQIMTRTLNLLPIIFIFGLYSTAAVNISSVPNLESFKAVASSQTSAMQKITRRSLATVSSASVSVSASSSSASVSASSSSASASASAFASTFTSTSTSASTSASTAASASTSASSFANPQIKTMVQNLSPMQKISVRYSDFQSSIKTESNAIYRQLVFNENVKKINEHNKDRSRKFNQDLNSYADMSNAEFVANFARLTIPASLLSKKNNANPQLPSVASPPPNIASAAKNIKVAPRIAATVIDNTNNITIDVGQVDIVGYSDSTYTTPAKISIDWSCKASPVISQGNCGSCYIIPPLQTIYVNRRIYNQTSAPLSVQQVLSCLEPSQFSGSSCMGGYFDIAYDYVKKNGIGRAGMYPFDARVINEGYVKPCNALIVKNTAYKNAKVFIPSSVFIATGDCAELVRRLQFGTISVSINVDGGFQFYSNGTYNPNLGTPNHGVTLVGYDPVNEYKIKNSWGIGWGNAGYAYVSASSNICDYPMYPLTGFETADPPTNCQVK